MNQTEFQPDPFADVKSVVSPDGKNILLMKDGAVIGKVKRRKISFGEGLKSHFDSKRLAALQAKQAKKQANVKE